MGKTNLNFARVCLTRRKLFHFRLSANCLYIIYLYSRFLYCQACYEKIPLTSNIDPYCNRVTEEKHSMVNNIWTVRSFIYIMIKCSVVLGAACTKYANT